jgi:hypothetical protein
MRHGYDAKQDTYAQLVQCVMDKVFESQPTMLPSNSLVNGKNPTRRSYYNISNYYASW